jgi:hypothetical protein
MKSEIFFGPPRNIFEKKKISADILAHMFLPHLLHPEKQP